MRRTTCLGSLHACFLYFMIQLFFFLSSRFYSHIIKQNLKLRTGLLGPFSYLLPVHNACVSYQPAFSQMGSWAPHVQASAQSSLYFSPFCRKSAQYTHYSHSASCPNTAVPAYIYREDLCPSCSVLLCGVDTLLTEHLAGGFQKHVHRLCKSTKGTES